MSFLNGFVREVSKVQDTIDRQSPLVLTIVGVIGIGLTVYSAIRATETAMDKMNSEVDESHNDSKKTAKNLDATCKNPTAKTIVMVKSCWKCYAPTAILGAITTLAFVGSYKISASRLATAVQMYEATATVYERYRSNVSKTTGADENIKAKEETRNETIDAIEKSKLDGLPEGKEVCLDIYTGNVFYSTREDILKAVSKVKDKFLSGADTVTINEFYNELDVDNIGLGDYIGWDSYDGFDIEFTSRLVNEKPCLAIDYFAIPRMIE